MNEAIPDPILPDYGAANLRGIVPALLGRSVAGGRELPHWFPAAVKEATQVVVLLIDAVTVQDFGAGIEKQDLQIASHVEGEGRGLVIAVNKWDLVEDQSKQRRLVKDSLERSLAQLPDVPLVTMSALEGTNLARLMQEVFAVDEKWNQRVSTGRLNRWLEGALEANPPPMVKGRRIKIRYMTQARTRPPTFARP